MKSPFVKLLLLALLAAVVLTGWQGLDAVSAPGPAGSISTLPVNVPPAVSGLAENVNKGIELPPGSPKNTDVNLGWTLGQIKAVSTSGKIYNSAPVYIAVLDTGIDNSHPGLSGKVAAEIDFSGAGAAADVYGHGTSVAGIIGAETTNGTNGIAPGAHLFNVKVADDKGRCRSSALARGIVWAVDNGARVINISLEIKDGSEELKQAVEYAWNQGAVVIAAAGNDGNSSPVYPAYYTDCLAVTAVKDDFSLAPMANYGDWVDVAAPGFKIYTTLPGNKYGYKYGTSFAAAYISRLAGMLFNIVADADNDGRLNDDVRRAIEAGYQGFSLPEL